MGTIVEFRLLVLDSLKYSSKAESPVNRSVKAVISRNLTASRDNHLFIYLFIYSFGFFCCCFFFIFLFIYLFMYLFFYIFIYVYVCIYVYIHIYIVSFKHIFLSFKPLNHQLIKGANKQKTNLFF